MANASPSDYDYLAKGGVLAAIQSLQAVAAKSDNSVAASLLGALEGHIYTRSLNDSRLELGKLALVTDGLAGIADLAMGHYLFDEGLEHNEKIGGAFIVLGLFLINAGRASKKK